MNWNYSEAIWQLGHSAIADRPALIHDDVAISYAELSQRCCAIGSWLQSLDLPAGSHVGHYMRNSNAYMETLFGAGLVGMSHVNVNYRYLDQELLDLCNGLDIRVLVYDAEFASRVAEIKDRLTETRVFVEVGIATAINDFAVSMSSLYAHSTVDFSRQTSPDDLILIATGGTTGLPKGTQWRHEDMWFKTDVMRGGAMAPLQLTEGPPTMEQHVSNVCSLPTPNPMFPLCPLMHGTGLIVALMVLAQGSALITTSDKKFDAERTVDTVLRHGVGSLVIVGDAFAIPLLEVLDRREEEKPFSTVQAIISSGSILSDNNKAGLRRHQPALILRDTLGSSEAIGFGLATEESGVFSPMPTTRVLDDNLQSVVPGSDTVGMAYSTGYSPIGYYNEPEKSAETFVDIDGVRHVKTGDRCTVREDGMLVLLGRDSSVINTGGEKVFTVEVELVLTEFPAIADVLVVGLPHPRFGKMVVAVVELSKQSSGAWNESEVQEFCRKQLADYKIPKHLFVAESLQRAANGKANYPFVMEFAADQFDKLSS